MKISVVVCVYNRGIETIRCLESILAMKAENYELLVVDDASTDDSPERIRDFARAHPEAPIRIVRNARNLGVSGARNTGIDAADGEVVLFTDSDCVVDPGWLDAYRRAFEASDAGAMSGAVSEPVAGNLAELAYRGSGRIGVSRTQRRRLMGCNMALRREWLARNHFDEALRYYCDEDEVAWRLGRDGYRTDWVPEASVQHNHHVDLHSYLREGYRVGVGSARFAYKRGGGLGHDLWLMTAALLTLPVSLLDARLLALPAILGLGQVAAIGFNERVLKGKDWRDWIRVMPLCIAYYGFKATGAYATRLRLIAGGETEIRKSKRALEAARRGESG